MKKTKLSFFQVSVALATAIFVDMIVALSTCKTVTVVRVRMCPCLGECMLTVVYMVLLIMLPRKASEENMLNKKALLSAKYVNYTIIIAK